MALATTGAAILGIVIAAVVIAVIGIGIKVWDTYFKHKQ